MLKLQFIPMTAVMLVALACSDGSTTSTAAGGTPGICPPGSERCACYGNGTCNDGLECRSNLCVADSGAIGGNGVGGGTNGGTTSSGGDASGGTSTSSVGNNGGSTTVGGTTGSGGSQNLGGSTNTGGASTNAGSSGCGDTSSDWKNCGSCGHVCANQGKGCGKECCVAGQCAPGWGPCITLSSGFTTCTAACASVGATCAGPACITASGAQNTWIGWSASTAGYCPSATGERTGSGGTCDLTLPLSGNSSTIRCCCTEP